MGAVKCIAIKVIKPKGALLDANTTPVPTKSTTSIKLASGAKKATAIRPKVLKP